MCLTALGAPGRGPSVRRPHPPPACREPAWEGGQRGGWEIQPCLCPQPRRLQSKHFLPPASGALLASGSAPTVPFQAIQPGSAEALGPLGGFPVSRGSLVSYFRGNGDLDGLGEFQHGSSCVLGHPLCPQSVTQSQKAYLRPCLPPGPGSPESELVRFFTRSTHFTDGEIEV